MTVCFSLLSLVISFTERFCDTPPLLDYGTYAIGYSQEVIVDGNQLIMEGSHINYTCDTGYVLKPAESKTIRSVIDSITSMAVWDRELPICECESESTH